jgi:ABC-type phosphate transport system substrate-binding protein
MPITRFVTVLSRRRSAATLRSHGSTVRAAVGLVLLVSLGLGTFGPHAKSQAPTQLLVIAHPGATDGGLDADGLRAIFLRKRVWWRDKQPIIPINYPAGDALRVAFDSSVLGFNGLEAARYWIDVRIRHGLEAPMSISSAPLVQRVIKQLPGSIGYVGAGAVPAGVRVVARVEGNRVIPQ